MSGRHLNARKRGVTILHSGVPGRVRLKVHGIYRAQDLTERLRLEILNLPGIKEASANALTENVLVLYESRKTDQDQIQKAIARLLKSKHLKRNLKIISPIALGESKPWHVIDVNEIAFRFKSSLEHGLPLSIAKARLKSQGLNLLPSPTKRSSVSILYTQINSLPVMLLIGSAAVSAIIVGLADAVVILGVVAVNTTIGYFTESSAEKAIGSLSSLMPNQNITLIRDGLKLKVPPSETTRGDLLILTPGMVIPADARVVYSEHLTIDESILTGESNPVLKISEPLIQLELALGDQTNMVFRGTTVAGGSGRAIVVATGIQTEIGRIQRLMGETPQPETPLQIQLRHLGNQVVFVSLALSITIIVIGILRGRKFIEILRVSTSLAIAAIPESLPTIATTTLARGMRTLEDQGVLIRHLDALETLGGIDIICLDKTGTLTFNQMTVTEVTTPAERFSI